MTALAGAALMALVGVQPAAAECGRVTIADMNWASAEFAAYVDKIILEEGYGCNVELVPGDTMPTSTSMMEKQEPDIAPELWINAVRTALDRAVDEGRLIYAAEILKDGGEEGWWIPQYFAEAHPDIKTVNDALMHPELFKDPENPDKGAVYGCPAGWNCQILMENLFKAYKGAEKGFNLIDPGSAAGLDGAIAKAYERKEPWLGYYWAPTSILGKYPMVKLGMGVKHDEEEWRTCTSQPNCADPKPNAWTRSPVWTVVTPRFAKASPTGMAYLKKRAWSNKVANEVLAYMSDNQYTGEDGARYFLKKYPDLWKQWVADDIAKKVEGAL
ncbi:MAG: ABC transporter substrate-binding protein [Alphaproteobacteria bacterium]|nr:ABC transporter substrate-binding protein [Alphaproteobacteria bacterium]MCB9928031.1 ABC transporter substrate-binding protein [Alphaproteobacteria bacterium]